jgi:hypothetical protein
MNMFSKIQPSQAHEETQKEIFVSGGGSFNVQANRLTNDKETTLKIKGAFKIRVQNKGEVGIKIFGNFYLPSYSDEPFETGDTNLGFSQDAHIEFDDHAPTDKVEIVLTNYYKTV